MKAIASRLAEKSRRGYRSAVTTLVRSYLAGDMAISEWSDGSTTTGQFKPVTRVRKVTHPAGDQGFSW